MGIAKDEMMKIESRGYKHSTKNVCASCFEDPFLQKYIRDHGQEGRCDFCSYDNGNHKYKKILPLDELMPVIMKVVDRDYDKADNGLLWDDEKEEYIGHVIDPWDFVAEELNSYMDCTNDKLILEIENIMVFEDRYSKYDFSKHQEELDMEGWKHYCKCVRASKLSAEQIISECYRSRASESLQSVRWCLEMVYSHIQKLHMVTTINTGVPIYRCGTHVEPDYKKQYDTAVIPAAVVGTAPPMVTNHNRMSEKGDMMFYGAFREEVAIKEIGAKAGDYLTTGIFHTNKRFQVLDLCTLHNFKKPSIFDVDNAEKRSIWFFLQEFMSEISKPVCETDKAQDEYKPTQVFTKFIQRKTNLGGIIYPSSKYDIESNRNNFAGERCVVLFVTNRDCLEEGDLIDKTRKQLIMKRDPWQRYL